MTKAEQFVKGQKICESLVDNLAVTFLKAVKELGWDVKMDFKRTPAEPEKQGRKIDGEEFSGWGIYHGQSCDIVKVVKNRKFDQYDVVCSEVHESLSMLIANVPLLMRALINTVNRWRLFDDLGSVDVSCEMARFKTLIIAAGFGCDLSQE